MRITTITDAIGKQTTLEYGLAADIYKVTKVTDPFGRTATFGYNPTNTNQLVSITDTLGLVSAFTYDPKNTDLITKLTTAYGDTTFTYSNDDQTIDVLYPDGSQERVEFNQGVGSLADPPKSVPTGMATSNGNLVYRNTFYWDRQACAYAAGDYTKARLYHWLHSANQHYPMPIPESTKAPLEGRVWYDYADQPPQLGSMQVGSTSKPAHVGRVLDDGTTQLHSREYNDFGNLVKVVDPVGRTYTYTYAGNGIDLLAVTQTRAGQRELMWQGTYDARHRPLSVTDAAGQATTFAYTSYTPQNTRYTRNGGLHTVTTTDALGQQTTDSYDVNGYLTQRTGPLGVTDTTIWSYDDFGRVRTVTDNTGYTLTYDYDNADRITTITYPDQTTQRFTYTLLDLTQITDRGRYVTRFAYNNVRQLTRRIDSLGQSTLFQWCKCGSLNASPIPWAASPHGATTFKAASHARCTPTALRSPTATKTTPAGSSSASTRHSRSPNTPTTSTTPSAASTTSAPRCRPRRSPSPTTPTIGGSPR